MDIYVSDYILSEGEAAGILEESLAKERIVGKAQRERFQAAVEAGVEVAFGSDAASIRTDKMAANLPIWSNGA